MDMDKDLATQIFESMNDDDRATFERHGWRNGEGLDEVLDSLETLKAEWLLARDELACLAYRIAEAAMDSETVILDAINAARCARGDGDIEEINKEMVQQLRAEAWNHTDYAMAETCDRWLGEI